MKATFYKGLSNIEKTRVVSAGQSVAEAFPDIDFDNAVVIVNGRERTADYILRESDVVTIRELPAATVVAIATAIAAVVTGIIVGIKAYKAKKAAEDAQNELDKVKKQSNKDDIDNRPFLRGASNTVANGKSQPYVCGRHLFTPYLLCSPFYKISGDDGAEQHTYTVLECGFNRQVIDSVSIEDIRIKKFEGGEPQEGAYPLDDGTVFVDGGMMEIAQDGEPFGELTELNYKVVSTACNKEIPRDTKVAKGEAEYLTFTLDANAMNVEVAVSFPYGLYALNDNGGKISTKVSITPQYSLDGGNTWETFGFSNGASASDGDLYNKTVFSKNISSKELRYVAKKNFTLDDFKTLRDKKQKNILLRVRSNGNDDSMIKNDCYVLFYQSRCFDPEKSSYPAGTVHDSSVGLVPCQILEDRERAFCTILGLKVKASANNEDKLKKINVVTQGVARTWNGRQWSGEKSVTRNAAAWALEILTSDSHPLSKFSDGEIDMESFGEFYDYCESNKFYFDYVITQGRKKGDTLNMILNNCGASLYWDIYGRLSVAIDRSKDNAIAVYNPQNIISIQNKKTFARRTDGLRVRYVSGADDLYQEDTYLLMREVDGKALELNADSAIKDVTVTGITTFEHVVKYARRMMALEILRPKTTTIEIGNEGIYFTPYSKVLLQDDSLKIGTGNGTIKALQWTDGKLEKIFLDCPVTFESGKNYGAIVNCFGDNKAVPLSLKVSGSGFTDALTVETPVSDGDGTVPETGCVVSFGELDGGGNFGRITTPYLISNISRNEKGFRLELVNYNEAVYSTGTIPDYKSNITQKPAASQAAIPPDFVTKDEMMEAIVNGIDTSAEPPDTPIVAECTAYRDYISTRMDALPEEKKNEILKVEWQVSKKGFWEDFLANISFSGRYEFEREKDGYPEAEDLNWQIRCRVTNTRGVSSEWSEPRAVDTSAYGTWRVSAAYGASARTYDSDSIRLSFSSRRPSERQYYGSTRFNVTVSYDGRPIRTETEVSFGTYYYFDRETDGYPERHENAADGIRDLSLYSFTIRPVEEYTGEIGEEVKVGPDESYYRTWLIPNIRTSATAQEHYVMLQWGLDGEIPYGTLRYDLYLGGEPLAKSLTAGYHAYRFAENLTKKEVAALAFTVAARNETHESMAEFSVDASAYLGYKVEKPWIKAAARKEGIDVSWNRTNDFYGKCEYVLLKDGEEIFRSGRETGFFLRFGDDEFPEKEDIERISLQARIEGDADSAESDPAETDCSGYLTWIPQVPKAYPSASGRSASLSWDTQDGVYGFAGCEIQIAKGYRASDGKMSPITDAEELEWYAPALGLNPYESVENYRRGEPGGRLEVNGSSVTFSLPLFGQDEDRACDTPYAFRLRGKTSAGKVSEWTEALFVTCKAVSASDVVRAWDLDDKGERVKVDGALGAAQIFVEELSAITANLGYITDGALRGNAYNYWAVSDTPMDDGSTLWRGSFRVGGSDQYILVEPRLKDGAPTGEYDITFVVGNYSVSATGTQIRGGSFEVYDEDGNLVFSASQDGSKTSVDFGNYYSTDPVITEDGYSYDPVVTVWGADGRAYLCETSQSSSGAVYIYIKEITVSNGKVEYTTVTYDYRMNMSVVESLACAKPGRVVFLLSGQDKIAFWEYDTESNKFTYYILAVKGDGIYEDIQNSDRFILTDYGLVYYRLNDNTGLDPNYRQYSGIYIGRDGRTATLFDDLGWWTNKYTEYNRTWPLFRDDESVLYTFFPSDFGSYLYKLDKASMVLEESVVRVSGYTPESSGETVDTNIFRDSRAYPTHPRIVDGKLELLLMCTLFLNDEDYETAPFRIRLVSIDLGEAFPSGSCRCRVYDWKPSLNPANDNQRILLATGFEAGGYFVCPIHIGAYTNGATGNVTPYHLEEHRFRIDESVPDYGSPFVDYREGALKNEKICDVDSYDSEDSQYLYRLSYDSIRQCSVMQNGAKKVFMTSFSPNGSLFFERIATFYAESGAGSLAKKPIISGAGFFKVLHDTDTGHHKYFLDPSTGVEAMIEFDSNGNLVATKGDKGEKGDPGDKGEKGEKGDRGDLNTQETINAAWPVGSIWITASSSLDPNALFGVGSWSSAKTLIGVKYYYFWTRNS